MKKNILSLIVLSTLGVDAIETNSYEFNGYLRGTYHTHDIKNDKKYQDDAVGGKLHFQTPSYEGLSVGTSLYFTTKVFHGDNGDLIPLRGEYEESYAILGEVYLEGEFGETRLKIGRQELNTPFADMDDIGMVPNTFEAVTLVNNDIKDTEIFLGQIHKMSGVGAEVVDKFTRINGSQNMQVLGVSYEGIENLGLSAWYNRLKDAEVNGMAYFESIYENSFENYVYGLGLQYANQSYLVGEDAEVLGLKVDAGLKSLGVLVSCAYNKINNNVANSGFGGGPFFAGSEFLVVDNAGKNATARSVGLEYDVSTLGLKDLTLGVGKMYIETESKTKAREFDFLASYKVNDKLFIDMVYADLKAANVGVVDAEHLHVYVNYNF
ncbi:MAG: Unknown protein [uncultured Sulfurovum sp.]|uniref:Outer membrane porin, OprD family n=1 Tax=uncultured Sulfurovum sp. TaxID=269237 RepID=A0A6S6SYD9_9BACT|nr:MAG: Unknown protein [uncultured Sulfurovum sp.]